jgi:NTE family protein
MGPGKISRGARSSDWHSARRAGRYNEIVTTALVLSAGAMWAAWEVGAWKALRERFQPDLIVGASAGAWNGWTIAGGATPEELTQVWLDPRTAKIMRLGLEGMGCFRSDMLFEKARDLFARGRPKIPFGLTIVEVPSLKLHLVREPEITWQHLAATCAIPFGFPPVRIGSKRYVDGGLRGALPLWAAEKMGATRAIALNVLNTPAFRLLRKTMRGPTPSASLQVVTIEPSARLGSLGDAVVWSAENIRHWIELGERDANSALTSVRM